MPPLRLLPEALLEQIGGGFESCHSRCYPTGHGYVVLVPLVVTNTRRVLSKKCVRVGGYDLVHPIPPPPPIVLESDGTLIKQRLISCGLYVKAVLSGSVRKSPECVERILTIIVMRHRFHEAFFTRGTGLDHKMDVSFI